MPGQIDDIILGPQLADNVVVVSSLNLVLPLAPVLIIETSVENEADESLRL